MSEKESELLRGTSKPLPSSAKLVLEDGSVFRGGSCGAAGEVFGEICFNTALEGYLEVITDPSYAGQICAMAYPQIGNYGVSLDDVQSETPAMRGVVVRDMCTTPSNWRSDLSLPEYLRRAGVVAAEGLDTRALVRRIRERGSQRAVLSTLDASDSSLLAKVRASAPLAGSNLVAGVSCAGPHAFGSLPQSQAFAARPPLAASRKVVVYDCGVKRSILHALVRAGCEVLVVPWDCAAEEVLGLAPDGVLLSNGPGDPQAVEGTSDQVEKLLGRVPVFGICLGHQMVAKAAGASFEKLKYGHRGANHPVMNLLTGRVEITAQNHGFGLLFPSLGDLVPRLSGGVSNHAEDLRFWARASLAPVVRNDRFGLIRLTHVNLNDGTPEGIAFLDAPAFSVQYHPEASPGPTDAHYLFTAFCRLMDSAARTRGGVAGPGTDADDLARPDGPPDQGEGRRPSRAPRPSRTEGSACEHLGIDIARDRLAGWAFGARKEGLHA